MPTISPLLRQFDRPAGAGALDGVRVIDFTRVLAGPFGTQILGDLGAEVIKIENPSGGDDTRAIAPSAAIGGESSFFLSLNRSKRSVAIDLKSAEGRAVVLDLLATADIVVENFSGAVMRRFELDYPGLRDRFPRLIYCSISGYGRTGSNADTPGFDSPVGAEAGVVGVNAYEGGEPVLGAIPYTDVTTALNATIGILAALHARSATGRGQFVDAAMFDSALANLSFNAAEYLVSGREPRPGLPQSAAPRGIFATHDGRITITCSNDRMFRRLCIEVVERPGWADDPRFATMRERLANGDVLLPELRHVFLERDGATWSARCRAAGIPCGVVNTPGQAVGSEQAVERELVFGIAHPAAGLAPAIAQPFRLSETPCRYGAPPLLGEHTRAVLADLLDYSPARIEALANAGAIGLGSEAPDTGQ